MEEGLFIVDTNFTIIYLNKKALAISKKAHGISYKVGDPIIYSLPQNRHQKLTTLFKKVLEGQTITYEIEVGKKIGNSTWLKCHNQPLKNSSKEVVGFTVLVKDISIQKHAEAVQLKQKELKRQHAESSSVFEAFMQNSPLVGWVTDDKGIMRYMNALYLETYGFTKADFGRSIFDIFPNQLAVDYYMNNLEVIKKNEAIEIIEKGIMADGREQILKIYKFPLSINGATLVAGWAVDITEQTELQEQFSRSVERYEYANQATSDAIYDWDTTTDIITKNSNFETIFGYQETTACISKRMQRIHPDDRERVKESYFASLADPSTEKWNINYRFLCADGKYKYVIDKAVIKREHHTAVRVIGALQDITVLKEMEQRIIDHEKSRKREVVRSIIEAQEKERRKLSVELHDNVNQMLSSCKLMLEVALDDAANAPMLTEKSYQCIQAVMSEIRKISHDLNPSALQDVGLTEAIAEMIEKINLTKKLNIAFHFTTGVQSFVIKEEDRIAIYRIIQEATNNVMKHARAKNASISLNIMKSKLLLVVKDDGVGYNPELITKGIGLKNIQNRADYFQGQVAIISAVNEGCELRVELNLKYASAN